jgi:formylglycine-generating enzyme required for sulfatase activity
MADSRSSMLTPAFAPIAGGWLTMGTQLGYEDERPPHRVFVDRFELGVCPVTRAEYECFMDATRHEPPRDWSHPPFAQPSAAQKERALARRRSTGPDRQTVY